MIEKVVESAARPHSDQWTISAPTPWQTSSTRGLLAVLREDRESTSALLPEEPVSKIESWLSPGAHALVIYRIGEWIQAGGPPRILQRPAALLQLILWGFCRSVLGIQIAKSVRMGRRVKFYHQHGVVIGGPVVIGDDCVFRHGVTIAPSHLDATVAPQIGARVSFGVGCTVLGGVRIGDGAIIGPHAVITTDIPPGATAVAPATRILRLR